MSKAIGIRAIPASDNCDLGSSKFFGTPTIPLQWAEDFYEDEIFFCQIRLSDIAEFDPEERLPHTGYLYVFLHTEDGCYHLSADVRYYDGEPNCAIDDFNSEVEGYEQLTKTYLMEFYPAEEDFSGTRLFGVPSGWIRDEVEGRLLMQYDPLNGETDFLDAIDGYMYLFFGDDEKDLSKTYLIEDYS